MAQVTVFPEAQVENTFSVMSWIVTKQTANLNIISAIQMIKYELSVKGLYSINFALF